MLTVEQVRSLDEKVRMAVDLIDGLKKENSALRSKLDEYKAKIDQLENVVDSFKLDQMEIEEGIKDVLTQLDQLEDQITAPSPSGNMNAETSQQTDLVDSEPARPAVDASAVIASAAAENAAVSSSEPAETSSSDEEAVPAAASVAVETAEPEIQRSVSENRTPELEIF